MKKILCILLVTVMMAMLLPVNVLASAEPCLVVSNVQGMPGSKVTVTVSLKNSPGFGGIAYDVRYDNTALKLVSYELGLGKDICTDSGIDTYADKMNFQYAGTSNVTGDGVLVSLVFEILKTTAGTTEVKVIPEKGTSFYYEGRKEIDFTLSQSAGKVTVVNLLPGDVTGDGKVDIKDYSRILSHVKKLNVFTDPQILSCADVTGDGKVDIKDYSRVLAHCKKLNPLF